MASLAIAQRDAELMLRAQAGDDAGFSRLVEHYRGPLVCFLYRMVLNQAVAEELAQDVFLRVYRARGRYQVTAKFSTWLYRIATNRALNWRRDMRKERGHESLDETRPDRTRREIPDRRLTVEQALLRRDAVEQIRRAIAALPGKQRAALLLHKYQELEYTQIARALECSESAVKSLLFRAYEHLRASLEISALPC